MNSGTLSLYISSMKQLAGVSGIDLSAVRCGNRCVEASSARRSAKAAAYIRYIALDKWLEASHLFLLVIFYMSTQRLLKHARYKTPFMNSPIHYDYFFFVFFMQPAILRHQTSGHSLH